MTRASCSALYLSNQLFETASVPLLLAHVGEEEERNGDNRPATDLLLRLACYILSHMVSRLALVATD